MRNLDQSVMIASYSRRIPTPSLTPTRPAPSFNLMDLSAGDNPADATTIDQRINDWEIWGEERVIEIFECHIKFDGDSLSNQLRLFHSATSNEPHSGWDVPTK